MVMAQSISSVADPGNIRSFIVAPAVPAGARCVARSIDTDLSFGSIVLCPLDHLFGDR